MTYSLTADRLAAMLNYFLKTLTGPESKSFKVSNLEKYSFRPGEVVGKICQIYLNLGECSSFVAAVSRDGRSYSPSLFPGTERVLIKVTIFKSDETICQTIIIRLVVMTCLLFRLVIWPHL